jgi:hypothetical protein
VAQVVECLPRKHEILNSSLKTAKNKQTKPNFQYVDQRSNSAAWHLKAYKMLLLCLESPFPLLPG